MFCLTTSANESFTGDVSRVWKGSGAHTVQSQGQSSLNLTPLCLISQSCPIVIVTSRLSQLTLENQLNGSIYISLACHHVLSMGFEGIRKTCSLLSSRCSEKMERFKGIKGNFIPRFMRTAFVANCIYTSSEVSQLGGIELLRLGTKERHICRLLSSLTQNDQRTLDIGTAVDPFYSKIHLNTFKSLFHRSCLLKCRQKHSSKGIDVYWRFVINLNDQEQQLCV